MEGSPVAPAAASAVDCCASVALSPADAAHMTAEALKCLLYSRGQIPCMYDDLERAASASASASAAEASAAASSGAGKRRRVASGGARRTLKFLSAVEPVLAGLPALFAAGARDVVIAFGPTLLAPKEVYRLRFFYDAAAPADATRKQNAGRALLRALVTQAAAPAQLALTKTWLLLTAPRDAPGGFEPFKPKPRLPLNMKRCKTLCTFACGGDCGQPEEDLCWVQAPAPVQGVRPSA